MDQNNINFSRIARAIDYLNKNFRDQPSLEEVAEQVHLSPYHFQRLFTDWAGVSPKKFLQYISVDYAKGILKENNATIFDAAYKSGLSGTGRLHDLFVNIEAMTPGEFKNGGEKLTINYSYQVSPFGHMLIASTQKGICHMAFADDKREALVELQKHFPNAIFLEKDDTFQQSALNLFSKDWDNLNEIKLHLKGTKFQIKVWEALLKIPIGKMSTYGQIAAWLDNPKASRAVGSAVGSNPVAFLIPCHRVIQSTGVLGQYHWGSNRKTAMIGWEAAFLDMQS